MYFLPKPESGDSLESHLDNSCTAAEEREDTSSPTEKDGERREDQKTLNQKGAPLPSPVIVLGTSAQKVVQKVTDWLEQKVIFLP